ncbi:putative protein DUF4293 [Leeuwenhoekiella aestuarii]|uniref:Transcription termination factor Rho n=1 Tax=Leeuwenhoekiella aestuarii TaxID=2249426 RepID=A0A4Q0NSL8_9FLAO|nr:DUF4293 domain-containing protein [Leeuwenhoekiella aestuarii]RXG12544.1 putative protein DUF4293 [Leeuwenhoekiella aestuarii]RXG14491.1 putative protein DUF4293 [Leeuwenhoekiella aestuarii]
MIQRIQSVYLILAVIVSAGLHFAIPVYSTSSGEPVYAVAHLELVALFFGSALLSLITIFLFKNRKLQFVLGRLNIILNFILLGVLVYQSQILSGGAAAPEKGIGMLIPIISIVFIALANKAIKRDEDLVKSVDRLR